MRGLKMWLIPALFFIILSALFVYSIRDRGIVIADAKIVNAVDENLMPVKIMDIFPKATSKISCWIKWQNAKINTQILAKWHYVTDDIPILDYVFNIPKKDGMGSVTLSMPSGKNLPSGLYRINLVSGKHILKSLTFKVE